MGVLVGLIIFCVVFIVSAVMDLLIENKLLSKKLKNEKSVVHTDLFKIFYGMEARTYYSILIASWAVAAISISLVMSSWANDGETTWGLGLVLTIVAIAFLSNIFIYLSALFIIWFWNGFNKLIWRHFTNLFMKIRSLFYGLIIGKLKDVNIDSSTTNELKELKRQLAEKEARDEIEKLKQQLSNKKED